MGIFAAYDDKEHMYLLVDFSDVQAVEDNHHELDNDTKTAYCDHHTCNMIVTNYTSTVVFYSWV